MSVNILKKLGLFTSALLIAACSQTSEPVSIDLDAKVIPWHEFTYPLNNKPNIVGGYANGCIDGAKAMPLDGPGHVAMRISRNRFYGHPQLIQFIDDLSAYSATHGKKFLVGDLSQPRGGPMNYGHASHQIGLDVDLWLQNIPSHTTLTTEQRESREFVSMVDKKSGLMRLDRWDTHHGALIAQTAADKRVARIFVNPIIKKHLCETNPGAPWLNKVRPWWGHDAHFHIRLHCPKGMTGCEPQTPPPSASGCDAALDQWIYDQANPKPKDPNAVDKPKPVKVLPLFCQTLQRIAEE